MDDIFIVIFNLYVIIKILSFPPKNVEFSTKKTISTMRDHAQNHAFYLLNKYQFYGIIYHLTLQPFTVL